MQHGGNYWYGREKLNVFKTDVTGVIWRSRNEIHKKLWCLWCPLL